MNQFKTIYRLSLSLVALTLATPAFAVPLPSGSDRGAPSITSGGGTRLQFPSTSDRGAPVTTTGGGTRGPRSCVNTEKGDLSVNALTPNFSNIATTASQSPTFYYFIPATSARLAEFIITDESDNKVYQETITLPSQPGIMQVKVNPKKELSSEKYYQWSFSLICDSASRDRDFSITGTLEFKDTPVSPPATANPLDTAKYFASKGLWLDTLDSIAPYHSQYPEDWQALLTSAGLETLITQPLVGCCDEKPGKWPVTGDIPATSPLNQTPKMPPLPLSRKNTTDK